jgi:hypothetical protein
MTLTSAIKLYLYLEKNNPVLYIESCGCDTLYEAFVKVAKHYGLEEPKMSDNVDYIAERILLEIKQKEHD